MSVNLLYYAVTFNSAALVPGNYYLNNFLLALVEIPGTVLGMSCIMLEMQYSYLYLYDQCSMFTTKPYEVNQCLCRSVCMWMDSDRPTHH